MPDSSASAAGDCWLAAYSTRPSPTSCSTPAPPIGVVALRPPGAEQVADKQLGVERTAHREQLPRRVQELVEQRV